MERASTRAGQYSQNIRREKIKCVEKKSLKAMDQKNSNNEMTTIPSGRQSIRVRVLHFKIYAYGLNLPWFVCGVLSLWRILRNPARSVLM